MQQERVFVIAMKRRQEHTGAPGAGLAHHTTLLAWDKIRSIPDLRDQLRPTIEDRQDLAFLARRQTHGHAGHAEIAVALQYIDVGIPKERLP